MLNLINIDVNESSHQISCVKRYCTLSEGSKWNSFFVGFFACVKFILQVFSSCHWQTFILIVSLVPFLSFYCHLNAALLLLCIIYGCTHSSSLLVFLFFALSAVK